jgi:hypothetical protein
MLMEIIHLASPDSFVYLEKIDPVMHHLLKFTALRG